MKKLIALSLLSLTICTIGAYADDTGAPVDQKAISLAHDILNATHARDNAELSINAMIPTVVQSLKRDKADIPEEVITKFIAIFREEVTADIPRMLDAEARIYATHYSVSELTEIAKFYESDVGKKVIAETPLILKETIPLAQAWGTDVGRRAAIDTLNKLRKQGVKI